jgi:formamidopyrimidine-DNA glycosylase
MPELPEVETIRRDLHRKVKDKEIKFVTVNTPKIVKEPPISEFCTQIEGKVFKNINRRGKYLVIELDSGKKLVIHLGMTGLLIYPFNEDSKKIINVKHNHLVFTFIDGTKLIFNDVRKFGKIYLVSNLNKIKGMAKLGLDPLDDCFKEEIFVQILNKKKKSKIKSFLMNQEFIAGLGNIYVNEVLYRANIHPLRKISSLHKEEIGNLYQQIKLVLNKAIQSGGSTVADEAYLNTDGEKGKFAEKLQVYARKGKPCIRCGNIIEVIKIEGRSTFICPQCQK